MVWTLGWRNLSTYEAQSVYYIELNRAEATAYIWIRKWAYYFQANGTEFMVYSWIKGTGLAVSEGQPSSDSKYLAVAGGGGAMVNIFCTHYPHMDQRRRLCHFPWAWGYGVFDMTVLMVTAQTHSGPPPFPTSTKENDWKGDKTCFGLWLQRFQPIGSRLHYFWP